MVVFKKLQEVKEMITQLVVCLTISIYKLYYYRFRLFTRNWKSILILLFALK